MDETGSKRGRDLVDILAAGPDDSDEALFDLPAVENDGVSRSNHWPALVRLAPIGDRSTLHVDLLLLLRRLNRGLSGERRQTLVRYRDDRAERMAQHAFCNTAEHQVLDGTVPVRAEHDDVGLPILCELHNQVSRSTEEDDWRKRARHQAFDGNQVCQTAFRAGHQVSSQPVEIYTDGFRGPRLLKRVGDDVGHQKTGARRGSGEASPVVQ